MNPHPDIQTAPSGADPTLANQSRSAPAGTHAAPHQASADIAATDTQAPQGSRTAPCSAGTGSAPAPSVPHARASRLRLVRPVAAFAWGDYKRHVPFESSAFPQGLPNPTEKPHLRLVHDAAAKRAEVRKPTLEPFPGLSIRLRAAREAIGLDRSELDERAGIANGRTGRIERGDRVGGVTADIVLKLAKALNRSVDWLLTGTDSGSGFPLRKHPGWTRALATAFSQWGDELPEWAWQEAGELSFPNAVRVTPELVRDCARLVAAHSGEHPQLPEPSRLLTE